MDEMDRMCFLGCHGNSVIVLRAALSPSSKRVRVDRCHEDGTIVPSYFDIERSLYVLLVSCSQLSVNPTMTLNTRKGNRFQHVSHLMGHIFFRGRYY